MLDLAGHTSDRDLASLRLLEPACGHAAFLIPATERLLESARKHDRGISELTEAIVGVDIDPRHVEVSRASVVATLMAGGASRLDAEDLAMRWVRQGDALLMPFEHSFDVVIGNPPYVRTEQVAPRLQAEYRARYSTLFDRADLYIAFIERGLQLLSKAGVLSLICADRWILNRYGGPLRALIAREWRVRCYLDLHNASPFESDVSAYPAIFCIGRESPQPALAARLSTRGVDSRE
jgi:23S rRNA G2445 N2-methylase RlmL